MTDHAACKFALWSFGLSMIVLLVSGELSAAFFCGCAEWFAWCWMQEMEKLNAE